MNIEEKAKAYDEALKKAEGLYKTAEPMSSCNVIIETLFPEFKESEDERIRKQILSFLKEFEYDHYRNLNFSSWIAWLEKQGEQKVDKREECNNVKGCITCVDGSEWAHITETPDKIEPKDYNSIDPHFAKPIDKVEPKFKAGDFVVIQETTYQITKVENQNVTLSLNGRECLFYIDVLKNAHLWTIEDAKDGDVLVHSSFMFDDFIFIYNNTSNLQAYCYYSNEKNRFIIEDRGHYCPWNMQEVTPVTKEQRDLLFTKMKEAGYNWNEKELKLEKI